MVERRFFKSRDGKKEDVTINYGKVLVVSRCIRDRGARGMLESVAENIERRKGVQ